MTTARSRSPGAHRDRLERDVRRPPPGAALDARGVALEPRRPAPRSRGVTVAENISVCRPGGSASQDRLEVVAKAAGRACRRPRRAPRSRGRRDRARRARDGRAAGPACRRRGRSPRASAGALGGAYRSPPVQQPMRAPVAAKSQASSPRTCRASSRVGVMTTARGAAGRRAPIRRRAAAARARGRRPPSCPIRSAPRPAGRRRRRRRRAPRAAPGSGPVSARGKRARKRHGDAVPDSHRHSCPGVPEPGPQRDRTARRTAAGVRGQAPATCQRLNPPL